MLLRPRCCPPPANRRAARESREARFGVRQVMEHLPCTGFPRLLSVGGSILWLTCGTSMLYGWN